jgi:streptomycin 6-kinase
MSAPMRFSSKRASRGVRWPRNQTTRSLSRSGLVCWFDCGNQDFHPRNILSAQRQPWLAVDPKPVVGDPAFDPVRLVVQVGDLLARDDPSGEVTRRLKTLSDVLSVDGQRIQLWALARCVDWALLSLERSDSESSEPCMAWARAIARAGQARRYH